MANNGVADDGGDNNNVADFPEGDGDMQTCGLSDGVPVHGHVRVRGGSVQVRGGGVRVQHLTYLFTVVKECLILKAFLIEPFLGNNHMLRTDNYYTSPALAKYFMESNTHLSGTVRSNCHNFPKQLVVNNCLKEVVHFTNVMKSTWLLANSEQVRIRLTVNQKWFTCSRRYTNKQ